MYRYARLFVLSLLLCFLFSFGAYAGSGGQAAECPCPCPEGSKAQAVEPDPEDSPEEIVLKRMVDIYEPVTFSHQEHADYADEGCVQCHHHQENAKKYKPCSACHERKLFQEEDKLNVPGLSGAYHRQCIECHVEMGSGPVGCTECHEVRDKASSK